MAEEELPLGGLDRHATLGDQPLDQRPRSWSESRPPCRGRGGQGRSRSARRMKARRRTALIPRQITCPRKLEIDLAFQGAENCCCMDSPSTARSGSLAARAIKVSQFPRRNDEGSELFRRSMTVWTSRRGKFGPFSRPVVDAGKIGRSRFSGHFDRRI